MAKTDTATIIDFQNISLLNNKQDKQKISKENGKPEKYYKPTRPERYLQNKRTCYSTAQYTFYQCIWKILHNRPYSPTTRG